MSVLNVNKENFDEIIKSEKPVLLDFYADWCGPCQMMSPVIHEIAEEYPDYIVGKVNVDKSPELAQMFSVVSIPMFVVIKEGKVVNQSVGYKQKDQLLDFMGL